MGNLQNWQNEINANTGLFKGFSHEHLTRIWNEVIEPWIYPAKGLHDLSAPVAFEYLIIRAFELEGADSSGRFQVLLQIDNDALTPSRERRGFLFGLCPDSLTTRRGLEQRLPGSCAAASYD